MTSRILIVHYTPPSTIGGVEHIIHQHIPLLAERGFSVEVVAGRTGPSPVPLHVIPEIDVAQEQNAALEAELDAGIVGPKFHEARRAIDERLRPLVRRSDAVIVHNAFTLHFSLALTSVLWELAAEMRPGGMIAWCHDLAWTNPLYIPRMHPGEPWSLLRSRAPNTKYVTVSEERALQLAQLWGTNDGGIVVVPNGIDPISFLRLSPTARSIVERYRLFERDIVLLLPVRITRRKNIQSAIRATKALKDRGLDVVFVVSGPVAPHHPGRSRAYLDTLKELRSELGVKEEVVFLADSLGENLDDRTVAELYAIADILLFPSSQEGFGLPILEAGLARVPIVLSDIPIFREVGGDDVWTFSLEDPPDTIAECIIQVIDLKPARLYRRVLRTYRWDAIVDRMILPLLPASDTVQVAESS
jgi:mannosylglucosylglycerate synthase